MALIEIRGVTKIFGPRPEDALARLRDGADKDRLLAETGHTVGLSDISLDVAQGETFVVMGLSGSGKSTLIRHVNRLIDPTDGAIRVDGADVLALPPRDLERFRRRKMGMVFQRFGLLPHRTVLDNVALGLQIQGVARAKRHDRAAEWLHVVGLDGYGDKYPAQLSGGMQQRVGLARALCTDPEILLMDEAFSALDPLIRSGMQDQLIALQARLRKTIMFITHDLDEALRLGDRIAILKDGVLSQVGTPAEILLHPADAYVEAFVRDVNRARVLTVDVVMKPPECRITSHSIDEALTQMRGSREAFAYVVEDGRYRGLVTRDALEAARRNRPDGGRTLREVTQTVPSVAAGTVLEVALPVTLESPYPVPVVGRDGGLSGILSRQSLARVFGEPANDGR